MNVFNENVFNELLNLKNEVKHALLHHNSLNGNSFLRTAQNMQVTMNVFLQEEGELDDFDEISTVYIKFKGELDMFVILQEQNKSKISGIRFFNKWLIKLTEISSLDNIPEENDDDEMVCC